MAGPDSAAPYELDRHGPLLGHLLDRAAAEGLYAIVRAQRRDSRRLTVHDGRLEDAVRSRTGGVGLHLFDAEGRCAFGATDGLEPGDLKALVGTVTQGVRRAAELRLHTTDALRTLRPWRMDFPPLPGPALDADENVETELRRLGSQLRGAGSGLQVRLGMSQIRDEWRILRSDGTDVRMVLTRCNLGATFSTGAAEATVSVPCHVFSHRFDLLEDPDRVDLFLERARGAAERAEALARAPHHAAGSFPLVIDYALAKGLAHEAFGHAAESDAFRSSILAESGRFRRGLRVGDPRVSIVDEAIRGDHADQPASANGLPRQRVEIVRGGRLHEALSDLFSAGPGGVPVRGCGRSESYRHPPLPRMSNIRIEVAEPSPVPASFERIGPDDLRDLLGEAGLLERHPRVLYLSGYAGGQVNPVQGDFAFHAHALFELSAARVRLFRPAIFSGPVLEALGSVRLGFGPLRLDALGTCGKWGQSVPSCGGSNLFLFLEPSPRVVVGGRS